MKQKAFKSFEEFWPYYLEQHSNPTNRKMHYIGTALVLFLLFWRLLGGPLWTLVAIPFVGYGFAWFGHFVFEKNKPATFGEFFYSLLGDFRMFYEFVRSQLRQRTFL